MDVVSDKNVSRLVATYGTTRIYEMDDKSWLTAQDGTVSWRNNNPGNLKFEYAGSSEKNSAVRDKDEALSDPQDAYKGVVDLDQWGNLVFESYDAGRAAQQKLIESRHANHTVDTLIKDYSRPDYSGAVHYDAQAKVIYDTALVEGHDLHGKMVKDMTTEEKSALLDGISRFEHWKAGTVTPTQAMTEEQVRALVAAHPHTTHAASHAPSPPHAHRQGDHDPAVGALQSDLAALGITARDGTAIRPDQHFGHRTKEAVEAFQQEHGLHVDGVAGPATMAAFAEAKAHTQAPMPTFLDARHPAHGIYNQAFSCVARIDEAQGRQPGPHTQMFAGALTSAAAAAGFNRIDHVVLSDDASRGWAAQGDLNSPFKRYTEVNVMQAIRTPFAQSSQEAAMHVQNNIQQQIQAQAKQMTQPISEAASQGLVTGR
ncbi:peptidoglycan-binding domain-containing protein [Frateuria defendens]|uniref:peptidoglycan-binding domain-containing protein n=1 Tax=Frateuria defendens TaxID=2219559 RepID=UPI00066FB93C|nr:peptidoglycan-binding domain-containing protein [Frateuria defendens]